MNKEVISDKQVISTIVMFIIGTSIIFATGIKAEKDIWMAVILSNLAALPFVIIYARLHNIFLGKDLLDIIEICFGRIIGKGIIILYTWFVFHTGVLVLMNLNMFVNTIALTNTPKIVTMIFILVLCAWIVKEGIEVMGRWSILFQSILICIIVWAIALLIPDMNVNNIRPMLYHGIKPVLQGAFGTFAFPFTQIVVFTIVFSNLKTKRSPYKVYLWGLFIGGVLILSISLMNLLVLGVDSASSVYYPSYDSARRIDIADFIQRIEISISIGFVLGAFVKGSIYLLATCKGIVKIFNFKDYRFIVIPVSLLMINLSHFAHLSLMNYFYWILEIWTNYAIPFQVILPIIIWSVAEIKRK